MTKIVLLGDIHYGIRNDHNGFLDNLARFFDNTLFPEMERQQIKTLVQLGDLFDRRKMTNTNTATRAREDFIEKCIKHGIDLHAIVGNHDTHFKSTNRVNSIHEFYKALPIHIYSEPTEVVFDGLKVLMIPWINDENRQKTLEMISATDAQIAMGHLEISGFEMYRGSVILHGQDRRIFDKFDCTYSGHYHHISTDGSVFYLGACAEFTWSDHDDPRGFHVFDTETRQTTFFRNPYTMFKKVWYDDTDPDFVKNKIDYKSFTGRMVKVIIVKKNNLYWYDKFIDNIEKADPLDLQIVEDHLHLDIENSNDIVNEAESTLEIFKKHIDNIENIGVDRNKVGSYITSLYNRALAIS